MSSVILGVGQCGNQLTYSLWKLLEPHLGYLNICTGDGKFPAVNIDSENKVVKALWNQYGSRYSRNSLIAGLEGCGSNWAVGYHGNKDAGEDSLLAKTVDAVRKVAERCSLFSGIIMLHSLAGGTGSGLGSLLCETLRDEYPMHYILSCVVAPYESGESPLQHYNASLCLSALQSHSDCILLIKNDDALTKSKANRASKSESQSTENKSVNSMESCNRYIARCLADFILPTDSVSNTSLKCSGFGLEAWELVRSVCPMPATKFVSANDVLSNSQNIINDAVKVTMHPHGDSCCRNLSNLFVVRGNGVGLSVNSVVERMKCVSWNPYPVDLWTAKVNRLLPKRTTLTGVTNCSAVMPFIETTVAKARLMFDAKAYLHWYKKHGCTEDEFLQAFTNLDTVCSSYADAIR